ncbi:hypothetical protein MKZ91_00715 [Ensifer sp. MJa1]
MLRSRAFLLAAAALAVIGGCQSAPKPEDMARTSLQTAPADLQLICANAVAGTAHVDSTKVLPVSSRALDATNYSVDLDAGGRKFNCVVDSTGSVKSVQPAA